MNFDYGNILSHAAKITWKYKALWVLSAFPFILSFLLIPFFMAPVFLLTGNDASSTSKTMDIIFIIGFFLLFVLFTIGNFVLGTISASSVTLGVVRAERGEGSLNFMSLLRDGFPFFRRVLTVMLIINLTIGLVFTIFFLFLFVSSIVTMGLASLCLQPIILLLTPLMFVVIGVMEAAQTGVIAENLNTMDAIRRAIQIVRENIWKYVIIALIVYFGTSILSSFIMMPLMVPIFAIPLLMESGRELSTQTILITAITFACIFFPVMTLFSGITGTFMKASLDITYLRLANPNGTKTVSE